MIVRNPRPERPVAPANSGRRLDAIAAIIGRPLVLAACFFMAGIIAHDSWIVLVLGLAFLSVLFRLSNHQSSTPLLLAAIAFLALGWARQAMSTGPEPSDISRHMGQGYTTLRGRVASEPEPSAFSTAFLVRVGEVESTDGIERCSGTVLLRIPNATGPFEYGDGIEVRGPLQKPGGLDNPGLFRYPEYLARMGVHSTMVIRRASTVRRVPHELSLVDRFARGAQNARRSLIGALDRALPRIEADLLAGIVLGQRTRLPPELRDDFAVTGATHILAASGMNVGIVSAIVFFLARSLRLRKSWAAWVAILAMLAYTLLAGAKPSIVRADFMATAFLAAAVVSREPDLPSALALAALTLLFWNPGNLYDPGFQLSFVVVAALIGVMPLLQPYLHSALGSPGKRAPVHVRLTGYFVSAIVISIVAQAAALPLIAQHFHQVSLLGILANALILPVIPLLFCGGFVVWAADFIAQPLAAAIAWPLGCLLSYVIGVARSFGSTPLSVLNVEAPGWTKVALYYAALGCLLWGVHLWNSRRNEQSR